MTNKWNQDDDINYARALPRRLPAEVLYDAIHRATGSVSRLPGLPPERGRPSCSTPTSRVPGGFLDLFGKPPRESACECERTSSMMLGPVLNLVNGPVVGEAITRSEQPHRQAPSAEKNDAKVIEELYLAVLCRLPTPKEMELGLACLKDGEGDFPKIAEEAGRRAAAFKAYEQQLDSRRLPWEANLKTVPVWTPLDSIKAEAKGRRQADQAARRLAPGQRQQPAAGYVHRDREHQAQGHHGHPAGSACPTRACRPRDPGGRTTATSC